MWQPEDDELTNITIKRQGINTFLLLETIFRSSTHTKAAHNCHIPDQEAFVLVGVRLPLTAENGEHWEGSANSLPLPQPGPQPKPVQLDSLYSMVVIIDCQYSVDDLFNNSVQSSKWELFCFFKAKINWFPLKGAC